MRRRDFVTMLGAAAAWPVTARAQQPAVPVIGFLSGASSGPFAPYVAAFRQSLSEVGYVEGRNVIIEYRWADGQYDRLPEMAAELVRRQVAVLVATGGNAAGLAAKAATTTIPIVFTGGGDPVRLGLVASLNRPGGNATGVSVLISAAEPKRLGLLRELVPTAELTAVLVNPNNVNAENQSQDTREAARAIGQQIHILHASTEPALEIAFATMAQLRAGALLVGADAFFNSPASSHRRACGTPRHSGNL